MKILHTIPGLSASSGGPSSCTYQLVRGLNNVGCLTDILAIGSQDPQDDVAHDDFIKYVNDDRITPLGISCSFGRYLKKYASQYDIIHANALWIWNSHQASMYARKNNVPYIMSPHGMLYPGGLKVSAWKKKIVLPLFQRKDLDDATLIHATCVQEMEHIRTFGLKNPIAVVPNCLELEQLPLVREQENSIRRFGFVGRINPYKNIHLILEAWNNLGSRTSNCELVIIGSGEDVYESNLKNYIAENNIRNVRFMGFLSGEALSDAVCSLDFQILFSISENFGMVVPEALVRGVPVITSKGTPWNELPVRGCGWWIDDSVDSLVETIGEAINMSEEHRREMGEIGREYVSEQFLTHSVAKQMKRVYGWVLSHNDKPTYIYN